MITLENLRIMSWSVHDTVYRYGPPALPALPVAAFDMDDTLIATQSGRRFPVDKNDWKWLVAPERLNELSRTHNLVVFTNQSSFADNADRRHEICRKIEQLARAVTAPVVFYVAGASDKYRKPARELWQLYIDLDHANTASIAGSFYVGDAAGRLATPTCKADFSCSDRKFARNAGIEFQTPEQFQGMLDTREYSWQCYMPGVPYTGTYAHPVVHERELVVLVGAPASGKSSYALEHFAGYVCVNQDTLRTPARCVAACRVALQTSSVVVDATNTSRAQRARYSTLYARTRCFVFNTPAPVCRHLNAYRARSSTRAPISEIVYRIYEKNHEAPCAGEGYASIVHVPYRERDTSELFMHLA